MVFDRILKILIIFSLVFLALVINNNLFTIFETLLSTEKEQRFLLYPNREYPNMKDVLDTKTGKLYSPMKDSDGIVSWFLVFSPETVSSVEA